MNENQIVLAAVQAMLGLVSPDVVGVALELDDGRVIVHIAVLRLDDEIGEDIDDLVADLEGLLLPESVEVVSRAHVGSTNGAWEGRQHRLIFLAKGHGVGPEAHPSRRSAARVVSSSRRLLRRREGMLASCGR